MKTENGYSYTINEALSLGIPIISTEQIIYKEFGITDNECILFKDGKINIDELYKERTISYNPPKDCWDKYLLMGASKFKEEREMKFIVKATNKYVENNKWDAERTKANNGIKVVPQEGDTWEVDYDRKEILVNSGYVTVVEEIKEVEVAVKEPVVEKAVKTTRKRTKKAE